MKKLLVVLFWSVTSFTQAPPAIPADDAVRVKEFYRLASQIQDQIWRGWSEVQAPLLLVTDEAEFLSHHTAPPKGFKDAGDGFYARPRQFPTNFEATFPAFGPPAVIVIGEPKNVASKNSTVWLITVMHEHFHQLQWWQPGMYDAVDRLGLSRGDDTGMWMLNYPFPYEKPEVKQAFVRLRDVLLDTLGAKQEKAFRELATSYLLARQSFFQLVSADDAKYFSFQLWQEGIARYTQIKVAEAAAAYQPSPAFSALPDFHPLAEYGLQARSDTLDELKRADIATWKRTVVYSLGAAEGLLLDRLQPSWKDDYFKHPLTMDWYFRPAAVNRSSGSVQNPAKSPIDSTVLSR